MIAPRALATLWMTAVLTAPVASAAAEGPQDAHTELVELEAFAYRE